MASIRVDLDESDKATKTDNLTGMHVSPIIGFHSQKNIGIMILDTDRRLQQVRVPSVFTDCYTCQDCAMASCCIWSKRDWGRPANMNDHAKLKYSV